MAGDILHLPNSYLLRNNIVMSWRDQENICVSICVTACVEITIYARNFVQISQEPYYR